jgi:S-sulfosulfanyl-L-cysteine sulfohydrolase
MSISRREFMGVLAAAGAAGMPLAGRAADPYAFARKGNVSLLHLTDSHAQLLPVHYREAALNIGVGEARGRLPHLSGEALLKALGLARGTRAAHAFASLDFETLARRYGKVGGYAHLATLVKRLRAERPGALLLDGGDTWQGSGTSMWTAGRDMVNAQLELGVDIMTGHWEFTYGMERVRELVEGPLKGRIEFVAQNIATQDFGDPVFPAYSLREVNGVPVAVIGQAFPYTPIANPRHLVADWRFGIEEQNLQATIDEARSKGAAVVVLLSHNGFDVDMKLAGRVRGLDAILGGHTHDGLPQPLQVKAPDGRGVLVTNAGSNGKYLGVLDLDVRDGRIRSHEYRLLPVFADELAADRPMAALIERERAPYAAKLAENLAVSEGLLYRRGNFNGSFDQLLLDALRAELDAPIALSPGFRWGTTLLPGQTITYEDVLNQTAITYPAVTVTNMTGTQLKAVLEDVCDNLFNEDPYYQQGGDMVRVGGLSWSCAPRAASGQRIDNLRLANGEAVQASGSYKVAGWASVAENVQGEPVFELVARHLRGRKVVAPVAPEAPRLLGMDGDPALA